MRNKIKIMRIVAFSKEKYNSLQFNYYLILFLLLSNSCSDISVADLRFAFIGDIHYSISDNHKTESLVKSLADEFDNLEPKPGFIIQTGDFFHGGRGEDIESEASFAFKHFGRIFDIPFFIAKGNHDARNAYEKNALPAFSSNLGYEVSKSFYSFNKANCHFIVLDCTADTLSEQLLWLEKDLEIARSDSGTDHIFVAGHYPLWIVARAGFNRSGYSVKVASLLAKYKVDAYFCGHTHNKTTTVKLINGQPLTQIMDAAVVEEGRLFNLAPFLQHVRSKPENLAKPGVLPLEEVHQIFIPESELKYYWGYQEGSTTSYYIFTVKGKSVKADWYVLGQGIKRSFKWDEAGKLTDIKSPVTSEGDQITDKNLGQIEKAWIYAAPWTERDSVHTPFNINGVPAGTLKISRAKMAGSPFWNKIEVPLSGLATDAIRIDNEISFTNPEKARFGLAHIFLLAQFKDGSFAKSSLSKKVLTSFLPSEEQYPNFPAPELIEPVDSKDIYLRKIILKFDRFYKYLQD